MKVAVVMTTYFPDSAVGRRRLANAKRVIQSIYNNLTPLPFLVVADDSGIGTEWAAQVLSDYRGQAAVVSGPNLGVGASLNRAITYLDSLWTGEPWSWLYLPDDFLLTRPLDLTQAAQLLDYNYSYVRLDLPHPNLACVTKFHAPIGWWLELSYALGGFVFATRPTLISRMVHYSVGLFLEQADSYAVELDISRRVADARLRGAVVMNPAMGTAWEHLSSDEDEVGRLTPWTAAGLASPVV